MNMKEAIAREAIRSTVHRYCGIVDEGRYEDLGLVMVMQARLMIRGGPTIEGLPAIIAALTAGAIRRRAAAAGNFQRHNITSAPAMVIGPDTATARHYLMVTSELGLDHCGTYEDRYQRHGDQWLIVQRVAGLDWVHPGSRFFSSTNAG